LTEILASSSGALNLNHWGAESQHNGSRTYLSLVSSSPPSRMRFSCSSSRSVALQARRQTSGRLQIHSSLEHAGSILPCYFNPHCPTPSTVPQTPSRLVLQVLPAPITTGKALHLPLRAHTGTVQPSSALGSNAASRPLLPPTSPTQITAQPPCLDRPCTLRNKHDNRMYPGFDAFGACTSGIGSRRARTDSISSAR
jgi:hypothetical protein